MASPNSFNLEYSHPNEIEELDITKRNYKQTNKLCLYKNCEKKALPTITLGSCGFFFVDYCTTHIPKSTYDVYLHWNKYFPTEK